MKEIIKSILIILAIVCGVSLKAQPSSNEKKGYTSESNNQVMPQFPGGDDAFYAYLDQNVVLPEGFDKVGYLKKHHNQYVPVSVGFTVDTDGSIINVKVIDGEDEQLDNKAKEIVVKMPKWEPGTMDGLPIKVDFVIPIRFNLM